MTCPIPQGGGCTGCPECSPEMYLPAQDPYPEGMVPGSDLDPFEQPREHPS
ncbi:hypothetical protein ABZX40_25060 [Streptomyces sp. NPDC004610]|uniref:hypothetical protein n=1 Tax=unclassified Streptomyces TaxID=2593676 RepID=UPI0033B62138